MLTLSQLTEIVLDTELYLEQPEWMLFHFIMSILTLRTIT